MATWPVSLPQTPQVQSWRIAPQSNVSVFQPEQGPPIDRQRSSAVSRVASGTFNGLTSTQVATFETFYETTLSFGVTAFTWNDPISGTSYSWKFDKSQNAGYNIEHEGGARYRITVSLIRLPS